MSDIGNSDAVTISIDPDGGVIVTGEIDMASGPLVETAAAESGRRPVVIDLGGVTFIDSSGLRSLLTISRATDGQVVLRSVGPEVDRLLEITGTGGLFVVERLG